MPLDDSVLDRAYVVFEEWGPNKRTPRKERIAQTFPELADEEIESVLQRLDEVSKTVWAVAELGAESKLGKQKVLELLQVQHPFLRDQGLQRAFFLANYYAWQEGYAQP
jgi:hypothetical protein